MEKPKQANGHHSESKLTPTVSTMDVWQIETKPFNFSGIWERL